MSEGWIPQTLEQLGVKLIDCDHKTPKAQENGIPYIGIPQLSNGHIDFEANPRLISEEDFIKWTRKANPQKGDIILSRRCNPGVSAYNLGIQKFALGQNLVILRASNDGITPEYLRWLCHSRQWWGQISKYLNTGAVFDSLRCGDIPNFEFRVPSIDQQNEIAGILSTIDDKIELLRQQNATLESMAQALFKSWFVDFDPVIDNALAAGRELPEALAGRVATRRAVLAAGDYPVLPVGVRGLFPDSFVFSEELGRWVPGGWEVTNFGSLLESAIGGDWGKEVPDEKHTEKSVIIRGTDMATLEQGGQSKAPTRFVEPKKLATRILQDGDIILEISGGSPTQSTGRSMRMTSGIISRLGGTVEPASFCRKFRPINSLTGLFAAHHLKHLYNHEGMWAYQVQSTGIANFQTTYFLANEILPVPTNQLLEKFTEQALPLARKRSEDQIISLTRLRDVLLPELISGRVGV